jgi:hypothetical protein
MIPKYRRRAGILIDTQVLAQQLLLPAHMKVVGVHVDHTRDENAYLVVESEHLPQVEVGEILPLLTPWYRRREDGIAELQEIRGYTGPLTDPQPDPAGAG